MMRKKKTCLTFSRSCVAPKVSRPGQWYFECGLLCFFSRSQFRSLLWNQVNFDPPQKTSYFWSAHKTQVNYDHPHKKKWIDLHTKGQGISGRRQKSSQFRPSTQKNTSFSIPHTNENELIFGPHTKSVSISTTYTKTKSILTPHTKTKSFFISTTHTKNKWISTTHTRSRWIHPHTRTTSFPAEHKNQVNFGHPHKNRVHFDPPHKNQVNRSPHWIHVISGRILTKIKSFLTT